VTILIFFWKALDMANWCDDAGKLVLRLSVGLMMMLHGWAKFGPDALAGIKGMLAGQGLPEVLAYGVFVGEIVAPVLMVIGLYARPAAAVFAFNMVVAVALAHRGDVLSLGPHGGWDIELQALYLFGAVAIALLGSGRWSVSRGAGRWD
jgi:putative oxidoreductase